MTERPPIRIALLGLAHVHGPFWAEVFSGDPRVRLERIWDDDVLRGVAGATRFRTLFTSDLSNAIDAVDAVAITSETVDHERLIAAAAAAGKPILCEKPVAIDLAQARRIAASLQSAAAPFMQSFSQTSRPCEPRAAGRRSVRRTWPHHARPRPAWTCARERPGLHERLVDGSGPVRRRNAAR